MFKTFKIKLFNQNLSRTEPKVLIQHSKFNIQNSLIFLLIVAIMMPFGSQLIFAAGDDHTVKQTVTAPPDVEAPTIPQNLSAMAVSTSQINLSWDASTDNTGVTGYRIFRDNVEIDTTANTSYSNTGLLPATLYTYKVLAFDAAGNESAQSDEASATTLSVAEEPPQTGGQSGGLLQLKILNFSVEPGLNHVLIRFETNFPSVSAINWGKTPDYEIGFLSSEILKKSHTVLITELNPGTTYFFKLEVKDSLNQKITLENQKFATLSLPSLPFNVSNLKALADEEKITLTWENPSIDFEAIRIIRSTKFFPRDPFDGELVYENKGEKFVDEDVLKRTDYFYAVFVRDKDGRYSSGALVRSRLFVKEEKSPDLFAGVIDLPRSEVHPLFRKLTLRDFKFIQDGEEAKFERPDTISIKGDRALRVSLDYKKVPEVLKTLTITLAHPADSSKVFSFLLRVNDNKDAYEASIAPLGEEGNFPLHVAILDHKYRGLTKITGFLKSILPFSGILPGGAPIPLFWFWLVLILLLTVLIWRLRPKQDLRMDYEART